MTTMVYAKGRCRYCGTIVYREYEQWYWTSDNFSCRCEECNWTDFEWLRQEDNLTDRDPFGYRFSPAFPEAVRVELTDYPLHLD